AALFGAGHRVRQEHVLVDQRLEPALLLLLGAVGREDLHVPGVRRRRAEHRGRAAVAADHLVEQTQLELAEAGAAQVPVEEDRPQALVLDLLLELADVRLHHRIRPAHRVREDVVERLDLLLAEPLDPVELGLELGVGGEIPCHGPIVPDRGMAARPCGSRPRQRLPARSASRAASASTMRAPAEPGSGFSADVSSRAAKPSSAMYPARYRARTPTPMQADRQRENATQYGRSDTSRPDRRA